MPPVLERKILGALKEINSKLDALIARLEVLEEKVVGAEEPEPEDLEAYREAERELREGKLTPYKKE